MPPMWLRVRKILAVDFDLGDLKALMLLQLLASLPLGKSLKNFTLDEFSTSMHSRTLDEKLKLGSSVSQPLLAPLNYVGNFLILARVTSANPSHSTMAMVSSPYCGPLSS